MSEELKIGDYCHASYWSDGDPNDPWSIGFLSEILKTKRGIYYKLEGEGVVNRWFHHCKKITLKQGEKTLRAFPTNAQSNERE